MTKCIRQLLQSIGSTQEGYYGNFDFKKNAIQHLRECVLVQQDVVMRRPTCTQETTVTLEVEVEFCRICDISINNRACRTISRLVGFIWPDGEEPDMMTFADHKDRNLGNRVYTKFDARLC